MLHSLYSTFKSQKIISIIRSIKAEQIIETVSALLSGGISCVEITFDHTNSNTFRNTIDCLDIISKHFGDDIILGAGTVLSAEEVHIAFDHNAKYIISPNTNFQVIKATKEKGMLSMPGALTPTEIVSAYEYGADIIKIFPIDTLGLPYLKALNSPLKQIPLSAVGGVTPDNIKLFLDNGATCVGIGSNLVNTDLVEKQQFDKIFTLAKIYSNKINPYK